MIVTVFRSRLKAGAEPEYSAWAARMSELATTMPGYVSHKGFVAPDGERVTIVVATSGMCAADRCARSPSAAPTGRARAAA